MRSILLILIIISTIPLILIKPHVGILVWNWLGFMNPHRLTWGFTQDFGFAQIIGGLTIFAWLISREPKRIPLTPVTVILAAFFLWMSITTFFALAPTVSFERWKIVAKMLLMIFIALPLINTKDRLNALIWVVVVSIGFFGVKGGLFVLAYGGDWPVTGPKGSSIESNNALAGALAMTLPLMRYLQLRAKSQWVVLGFWAALLLCSVCIFATYSRGGFLAFAATLLVIWLRSGRKLLIGSLGVIVLIAALSFMPGKWYDRIESIQSYEQDASSMGRITMWKYGVSVAMSHPLTGGGFQMFKQTQFYENYGLRLCRLGENSLDGCAPFGRASHSVYFEALGEHGFVGLALFLMLGISALATGNSVIRMTRGQEDLIWMSQLGGMLQASIVGYAVMGLTANITYFDLYYTLVILMVLTHLLASKAIVRQGASKEAPGTIRGGATNVVAPLGRAPGDLKRQ